MIKIGYLWYHEQLEQESCPEWTGECPGHLVDSEEILLDQMHDPVPVDNGNRMVRCYRENGNGVLAQLHKNEFGDYWCDNCCSTFPQPDENTPTGIRMALGCERIWVLGEDGRKTVVMLKDLKGRLQ